MSFLYQFGEELQEEGDGEQSDVHAIDVGIGCHNYFIVAQGVKTVLYIECCLQQIELLILVHYFLCESEGVKRLATKREHRLCVHIAALRYATAG